MLHQAAPVNETQEGHDIRASSDHNVNGCGLGYNSSSASFHACAFEHFKDEHGYGLSLRR